VPVNVALKNQIKGIRWELANSLQEAATVIQELAHVKDKCELPKGR
jgi:hypothetical protein